jgi:amidase
VRTPDSTDAFTERFEVGPIASGALDGRTFAVKDLIDVAGHTTGCGNPRWRETHPPAAVNAVVVDLLLASGATLVGKTVTDELAFSIIGENAHDGTPLNPRAPDRVPGGSSSGSASAVARGECDFALGTDTTGSVRVPAANCGLFGMRPSHGRASLAGVMPFSGSFDTVGALARDLEGLERAMDVLLGQEAGGTKPPLEGPLLPREAWKLCRPAVADACRRWLSASGITASEVDLVDLVGREGADPGAWLATHCQIQWAEIESNLASWIAAAQPRFGPLIAANFALLASIDRPRLPERVRLRERLAARLDESLAGRRLLCFPTTSAPAPPKGRAFGDRREDGYMAPTLILQTFASMGRLPQVTVPAGEVDGAPVGLSFLAASGDDAALLAWLRHSVPT